MTRPDFNADPEVYVLNELLWTPNEHAAAFVLDTLREDDFFNPMCGQLFVAIKDNHARGGGRDAVSVNELVLSEPSVLGVANTLEVSRLLVNVSVLDMPRFDLRGSAYSVLHDAYRRGFEAMAGSLALAAAEAPTDDLFDILVDHGKQQRAAAERLAGFFAGYDAARAADGAAADAAAADVGPAQRRAPESLSPLERVKAQTQRRDAHPPAPAPEGETPLTRDGREGRGVEL
ncbi:DnaB-like helicase N-terminal domain-containing protein [Corynebacterium sanguinis]|uniref:DnaB-like helicase N-terminal domain-containing protein n=1 Tax=Corynebacterium sanguinis TaxID=2594913 RepID=UPI0021A695E0|nr:DnaB-like helicase N-terminal domain-containing protein [Corynebacterium sanguinis]MCT1464715.1 hypothetical protein [Corynebacterium sanguinis]MCT2330731.1 hypothetical protein [Corynebacterium sanguinis]